MQKKQYQKLHHIYKFDKTVKTENPTFKKYNRSKLIYNSRYSFYEFDNIKKFNSLSHTTKYPILPLLYINFNLNNLNPQKESAKEKKVTVCDNASELYNEYLEIYFDEYKALSGSHKRNLGNKYDPTNLFLETYD